MSLTQVTNLHVVSNRAKVFIFESVKLYDGNISLVLDDYKERLHNKTIHISDGSGAGRQAAVDECYNTTGSSGAARPAPRQSEPARSVPSLE